MLGLCLADAIRRFAEARYGAPEVITRAWTARPYLTRWKVAECRDRKVFLHHFQDSDADEPHDHPWNFTSLILAGGYWERTPARHWVDNPDMGASGCATIREQWFAPGRWLVRPARWIHSVRIPDGKSAWTLLVIGKKLQPWGFWCPVGGWIPWRQHLTNFYQSGSGCPQ